MHANHSRVKPRPHQQQCRSNIVECCKSNDSFDKVECCFDIVAVSGNNVADNNVERNFVLVETNRTCSICRRRGASNWDDILFVVAKNGNNIEATFDFVEWTKLYD